MSFKNKTAFFFIIFIISLAKTNAQGDDRPVLTDPKQFDGVEAVSNHQSPMPVSYKYVGNSFSNKFHRPSCVFATAISQRHLILFQFRKQAIEAHFQPCRYCLPPIWLSVRGVLLPLHPQVKSPSRNETDKQANGQKAAELNESSHLENIQRQEL